MQIKSFAYQFPSFLRAVSAQLRIAIVSPSHFCEDQTKSLGIEKTIIFAGRISGANAFIK
jgi:hypothetical protein